MDPRSIRQSLPSGFKEASTPQATFLITALARKKKREKRNATGLKAGRKEMRQMLQPADRSVQHAGGPTGLAWDAVPATSTALAKATPTARPGRTLGQMGKYTYV